MCSNFSTPPRYLVFSPTLRESCSFCTSTNTDSASIFTLLPIHPNSSSELCNKTGWVNLVEFYVLSFLQPTYSIRSPTSSHSNHCFNFLFSDLEYFLITCYQTVVDPCQPNDRCPFIQLSVIDCLYLMYFKASIETGEETGE